MFPLFNPHQQSIKGDFLFFDVAPKNYRVKNYQFFHVLFIISFYFLSWFPCSSVVPLQLHRVATLQQLAVCKVSTHGFDALTINGETSILASHVSILGLPWRCRRHHFVDSWMALSIVYPTCHSHIIPRYLIPSQETLGHFSTGSICLAGLRRPYVFISKRK